MKNPSRSATYIVSLVMAALVGLAGSAPAFTQDKKPVGSLTVFAVHADTVGGTEYSADYSGQLAAELRREFGDNFTSVFGLGTCGDINHIDVSGARRYDARLIGQHDNGARRLGARQQDRAK